MTERRPAAPLRPLETTLNRVARLTLLSFALLTSALAGSPVAADAADAIARSHILEAHKEYQSRIASGKKAEALGPAKRAYHLAQRDLTEDDEELAITAYALGRLLLELDRPLDALPPLAHALQCYEHQQGPLSAKSRAVQHRIAEANHDLERWETAELDYLDLISRYEQLEGDHIGALAHLNARLSRLTWEAGAQRRSRRYGLRALDFYKQSAGPESLAVGMIAVQLGRDAFDLDDYKEGLKFLEYGVPMIEAGLEPGDPQLTTLYEFLIEVYSAAGDAPRERRYRVRLKKNKQKEAPANTPDDGENPR